MTTTHLINSAQFITDADGNKKAVVLDLPVWAEIITALEKLELLEGAIRPESEAYESMLLTEPVLRRDWDSPEEDAAWADL